MKQYIAFDSHKHYTLAEREDRSSGRAVQHRVNHRPGAIRRYLHDAEQDTVVAVEAIGNWYWIVDEIEAAHLRPALVHPRKAKLILLCEVRYVARVMGMINKTDKLDVHGLNPLQPIVVEIQTGE